MENIAWHSSIDIFVRSLSNTMSIVKMCWLIENKDFWYRILDVLRGNSGQHF